MELTLKKAVAQILEQQRGRDVSGAALAKQLGVSRSAVWKAVEQLRAEGRQIEAIPNKGYRLTDVLETLSAQRLMQALGQTDETKIIVADTVTSTNLVLKQYAEKGAPEGTVVLAAAQSAGRGRLGRSFYSPDQTGMYLSLLLRPKIAAHQAVMITVAAAAAVQQAIFQQCGGAQIKWVNDLYLDGKKICGILTEAAFDCEVRGDGLRRRGDRHQYWHPAAGLPEALTRLSAACTAAMRRRKASGTLAARIVRNLTDYYHQLPKTPVYVVYREKNMILADAVRVSSTGRTALAVRLTTLRMVVQIVKPARKRADLWRGIVLPLNEVFDGLSFCRLR
jgi:BirA family biotin operon repressor/biotin-[acetyl-CoA-carboxylase] ligase